MFGELHIEMAALGTLLEDSGWNSAIVEAGLASSGTAESFLTASSVTKTRQAHQITACTLYKLIRGAYEDYCSEDSSTLTFEEWRNKRLHESFGISCTTVLASCAGYGANHIYILIHSFREGNFTLYHEALSGLIPYFFVNKNVNYARWLPVCLKDMMSLEQQHPEVAREFHKGNFVVHRSRREFSAIANDQAHEQNNTVIKGDGEAVGSTEDPGAL